LLHLLLLSVIPNFVDLLHLGLEHLTLIFFHCIKPLHHLFVLGIALFLEIELQVLNKLNSGLGYIASGTVRAESDDVSFLLELVF